MLRWDRIGRAALALGLTVSAVVLGAGASQASTRGQGTMLVRQEVRCEGTGNESSVYLPFALFFTGFDPHETGTVAAYAQPGGQLIGSASITLDGQGNRCVEVVGEAPPGQYKIVYDFGSGTGKQKVIRLVDPPGSTHHPTTAPTTSTASPTTTSASPTTTSASPTTTSASPTATSPSATRTSGPDGTASPSATEPGHVDFIPEDLAPTGASTPSALPAALVLLAVGGVLVLVTRRGTVATATRRH